jgi:hypothetical protein
MNKVSPEFLPHQNDAQRELIEDLIKKRGFYNEALSAGRKQDAEKFYNEYQKLLAEIKIEHPEYMELSIIDEMLVNEAREENEKHILN